MTGQKREAALHVSAFAWSPGFLPILPGNAGVSGFGRGMRRNVSPAVGGTCAIATGFVPSSFHFARWRFFSREADCALHSKNVRGARRQTRTEAIRKAMARAPAELQRKTRPTRRGQTHLRPLQGRGRLGFLSGGGAALATGYFPAGFQPAHPDDPRRWDDFAEITNRSLVSHSGRP